MRIYETYQYDNQIKLVQGKLNNHGGTKTRINITVTICYYK